ncbi:MAG: hypothetical protein U9R27_01740 [Campylobacterota bacterium]|nr:hypothetical protein [Campylobacterota bacterium]
MESDTLNDSLKTINQKILLENNQQLIAKRSLIVAGVFAILMILPFMEWSPIAGFWAVTFISLILSISSLLVAWMYRGRSERLESLISGENLLAEWRLTAEMKESYIDYYFIQKKEKNLAILTIISIIATIVFGIFILLIDEARLVMFITLISLILFLSLFAFGMPYYYRHTNQKGDGWILIGAKYAYINGYFHNWDFPLSGLSKIEIIKKPFYGINLIYYYTDRTLLHSEELFIPANEDIDLDILVESMNELNQKRE